MEISKTVTIPEHEIEMSAVRSQGRQNVNMATTQFFGHRGFLAAWSLQGTAVKAEWPAHYQGRVIVIKAQEHRSQEQNWRTATAARFDEERDALPKPRKKPTNSEVLKETSG